MRGLTNCLTHAIPFPTPEELRMSSDMDLAMYMAIIGAAYAVVLIGGYQFMHWRTKRMIRKYHEKSGKWRYKSPPNCS
jgi:hypothetical protein